MNAGALLLALCAATIAVTVAACSKSGGGSPSPPSLVSGTYIYSGASLAVDSCGLGAASGFDDFKQELTVGAENIVFNLSNGDPVVISGDSSFTATLTSSVDFAVSPNPFLSTIDWTSTATQLASGLPIQLSTGYQCVESVSYRITGTITGKNTFIRHTTLVHGIASGSAATCVGVESSEFGAVIPSFPCTATLAQDAALAP